jgi:hypothetical protein
MTTTRRNARMVSKEEPEIVSSVSDAHVDEFLRKVLEIQREYYYENDKKIQIDRRTELRKYARIILGLEKRGPK